ncbi:MAG: biotin/lipoyl-binding protein, partial [Myxococcales bacterium]
MKNNRPAWFLVTAGALLGAMATAGVSTVFAHRVPPPVRTPAPYLIEPGAVRLREPGPFRFETAAAESGPPLARTPVTARVTTREQLTAPSFAPLDGRVAEVAVRLGDRVKQGDRLVLVRSGDLATLQRDQKAAQLAIETKQAIVQRLELLVEGRAASQNELLVARSELAESRLVASAAGARLRSLSVRSQGDTGYWVLAVGA